MAESSAPNNVATQGALKLEKRSKTEFEMSKSTPSKLLSTWKCGLVNYGCKQSSNNNHLPRGWKTTPYILGNEISERMASFGLTWSMILYLIQNYNMTKESAAYCLGITMGITGLTPLLGGFLADTYLGRYLTIVIASISNFLGMVCLLVTAIVPGLTPPSCSTNYSTCRGATKGQLFFLFTAFIFLAIGAGGLRPCTYPFGADQFAHSTVHEKTQLQSFFNWYYAGINFSLLMASTVVAYIQLEVSWTWGFGVPTALMAISVIIFICGSSQYIYVTPQGSPFTELAHVVVAAYRKRKLVLPTDASKLYQGDSIDQPGAADKHLVLAHTDQFRFLDKAAVKTEEEERLQLQPAGIISKWRLCEVGQVEALKCVLRVIPIWAAGIIPGTYLMQQGTWLTLQANTMDRHVGRSSFQIPASSMSAFAFITTMLWLPFYDKVLVPLWRRRRIKAGGGGDPVRGITLLQRIGIGYVMVVMSPIIAALVEAQRRQLAGNPVPLSVMWLAPQLVVFGVADAFNIVGQVEYLYEQVPPRMRSMAGAMFSCTLALGSFVGSIVLAATQKISGRLGHHHKWINNVRLSSGHLDYYYFLLAVLLSLNCVYFFCVCKTARYNYRRSDIESKADEEERLSVPSV